MARIVLGSYMFRYPLGGMLSWALQYLLGLKALGHEVYFVEKFGYANSCYNPLAETMSDDCRYGLRVVGALLKRFGFQGKWCFVENGGRYHGISKTEIEAVFSSADVYFDMGTHGSWAAESMKTARRVLIDGEPGFTQIKFANRLAENQVLPEYDFYYTNGKNIGINGNPAPTSGLRWRHVFHPVQANIFSKKPPPPDAPYATVMNWRSHAPIRFQGKTYGQKDIEFEKFIELPKRVSSPLAVAVSGKDVPRERLLQNGWQVQNGREMTLSFDAFCNYLTSSRGEFSVCKNVFVANNTAWFSDKSAAYLASGRPVVLQDTGFSAHLPCGAGLFAVRTVEEAADAINTVERDYERHARAAREIATEYFDAKKIMKKMLHELGL